MDLLIGTGRNRTEIFSPDYLFMGPRPAINSVSSVGDYGGTIEILTPDAPSIYQSRW